MSLRAAVLTVSDRAAAGARSDEGGPVAVRLLREAGWECDDAVVVADGVDSVATALRGLLGAGAQLVVTTGGTGVSPRDRTPEATARVLEREVPGIAEELRRAGVRQKPTALLSRGLAGVAGGALVVNLPGSVAGVSAGIPVLLSVARHVVDQLTGGDH